MGSRVRVPPRSPSKIGHFSHFRLFSETPCVCTVSANRLPLRCVAKFQHPAVLLGAHRGARHREFQMTTRLADQPAVLEWVSGVRAAGHHQPLLPTHERMNCETVSAAVDYAKTKLPETHRTTATITAARARRLSRRRVVPAVDIAPLEGEARGGAAVAWAGQGTVMMGAGWTGSGSRSLRSMT